MATFIAHYRSADASTNRAMGSFEFESDSRLGSKANSHEARVRMLEIFGNDALSWSIDGIERKDLAGKGCPSDGQLEIDFRDPVEQPSRKRRRSVNRGMISGRN